MSEHDYIRYTRGCRCDECRAAKAAYMREKRAHWARKRRLSEADGAGRHFVAGITHGYSGYQDHSCRCEVCCASRARPGRVAPVLNDHSRKGPRMTH